MSVRQRKDRNNKWEASFYIGKKRFRILLPDSIKNKRDASDLEKELKLYHKEEPIRPTSNSSITSMTPMFFEYCEMHKAQKTTKDIKYSFNNHIIPTLGYIKAESINHSHFHLYKKKRREEGGSNRTINKEIAYIGSFYKWGKQHGYLSGLHFRIESLPYKRPIPNILSFDEIVKFINAATPDIYRVFFLTIYNLGLRINEARNITWENVDLENRTITVLGKGNKERRLPYGQWLHKELLRLSPGKGYIFSGRTGKPIQDARKAIQRAKTATGITKRIHAHLLRHCFATHLLDEGVDTRIIQRLLGHADQQTTQWYTQVSTKLQRDASNKILP